MTDIALNPAAPASVRPARRDIGLKRRYAAERRFKLYGITAIAIGLFFLVALMYSVFSNGYTAFWQTEVNLAISLDPKIIDPDNKRATDPNCPAYGQLSDPGTQCFGGKTGRAGDEQTCDA